jgi:hypothetical protein
MSGCIDGGNGSDTYSSSSTGSSSSSTPQVETVYVPKHYNNALVNQVYSVSAGDNKYLSVYLNPDGKSNYQVYGSMTETADDTSGVQFYIVGPDGSTYVNTGEKVRSYSFNIRPMTAGNYYFYLDNSNTLMTNKLPKLVIYEEYDQ